MNNRPLNAEYFASYSFYFSYGYFYCEKLKTFMQPEAD